MSEAHIAKYTEEYAILPLYFEYKHLSKLVNTYGSNWLQYVNPVTNRVHSSYFQILNTGRISSNNPNLQNVPNEEKRPGFRRCFTVSEGKSIIVCDYSGQESRVLAEFSQDSNMIHFFNYGDGDMHTFTASKMFNKPANEVKNSPLRQIGKILNFSIAYGASAHKVSDTFKVDMRTAQSFIDKFYKAYPKLQTYFKMKQAETLENGYVLIDSVTNRRSYCRDWDKYMFCKNLIDRWKRFGWGAEIPPKIFSTYYRLRGEYQRNAQNYPIQGASSSMTKLAAVLFRN